MADEHVWYGEGERSNATLGEGVASPLLVIPGATTSRPGISKWSPWREIPGSMLRIAPG